jgi:cholesterol transport system auxiliary component
MALSAEKRVAPGALSSGPSARSITVLDPEVAKKLDTVRVPVQVDATTVAYVKDAQWVDTPRHMFQGVLSETISAGGKLLVLAPGQFSSDPGKRLLGEIVDFGIDARTRTAVVTYDATLTNPDGTTVSRKRFTASEPVSAIDAANVGNPLNTAANKVAADVADWLATQ